MVNVRRGIAGAGVLALALVVGWREAHACGAGKLVGIASGGTCAWAIDGRAAGHGSSVTVEVALGDHVISCTPHGRATRSQIKHVEAGRPAMALFKLGR